MVRILKKIFQIFFFRPMKELLSFFRKRKASRFENVKKEASVEIVKRLNDVRSLDLGRFLLNVSNEFFLPNLTFIIGGSGVLDYAFLKACALSFKCKTYLEVGTYIGESINIMSEICERCYSVTAGSDSPYYMRSWCKEEDIPNYSEFLAKADNIIHCYCRDSKEFDYDTIRDKIDLYFIDGDHSYLGVKADTEKIWKKSRGDSVIVWHDFKTKGRTAVAQAVYDVLGGEFFEDVFIVDNNICGIYIPKKYQSNLELNSVKFTEERQTLWTYNTQLVIQKI